MSGILTGVGAILVGIFAYAMWCSGDDIPDDTSDETEN